MENEVREDMIDEVKPMKKYQLDMVCRFEVSLFLAKAQRR